MKLDFSKYHLKSKYRKALEHLSDEEKIRTAFKKNASIKVLSDICEYYNLRQNPLIKALGLEKYGNDPESAYYYAANVIKARWKEVEETIKADQEFTFRYVRDVVRDRWPEVEETIKTDPYWAYCYSLVAIRARWPEAEPVIKTSRDWAFRYARDVAKDENFWHKQS